MGNILGSSFLSFKNNNLHVPNFCSYFTIIYNFWVDKLNFSFKQEKKQSKAPSIHRRQGYGGQVFDVHVFIGLCLQFFNSFNGLPVWPSFSYF